MAPFETIMIILAVLIVLLVGCAVVVLYNGFKNTWHNQNCMYDLVNNGDEYNTKLMHNIFDQLQEIKVLLKTIEQSASSNAINLKGNYCDMNLHFANLQDDVNHIKRQLDEMQERQPRIDWDKLSKEQQDEFLKRLICPDYDSPFQPPFNPTCETTNNDK